MSKRRTRLVSDGRKVKTVEYLYSGGYCWGDDYPYRCKKFST